jgi:tetratricopeptide (TPR) repeat protein
VRARGLLAGKQGAHNSKDFFVIFVRFFCLAVLIAAGTGRIFAQDRLDDPAEEQDQNANAGYRYLLKEVAISVNSKGLKTTRTHNRIEIQKQHAVDAVGDVSIPYNAFRSEARLIKAFTQTADGRTVQLRKESIHDLKPEEVSSCQMYSDVHQLTFSMPALGKGAVIDYEVEVEEKKPIIAGEFWASEFLDGTALVCTSRVSVAFPAKRDVIISATNLNASALVTDTTNRNTRMLTWELRNVRALEYETGMPPYSAVRAQARLTSVKSWEQVERWYAALAEKHLQPDEEIQMQARKLVSGLSDQMDQIQALYEYASRDVRYVGVELGRSDYEPHSPRETMQNKYGDCKDKAALLVSLLKAVGIRAHLAIVKPSLEGPVDPDLPSPAQFNHVIVYVPRGVRDLWIDATEAFGDVSEYDYHLDDIDALVVGVDGKTFMHVPALDETHSVHRVIFDVDAHYGGFCTVHEIQEYTGRAAFGERARRSRIDQDKARKQMEHNLASGLGYSRLLNYSVSNLTNPRAPLRAIVDYDSDSFFTPTKSGLSVRFDAVELRNWVDVPRPDVTSARKHKRMYPWVARVAHTEEIVCRLHLAEGYALARAPSESHKDLPHGKTELLFDRADAVPSLTLRVSRHRARLNAEDLPEVAQQVDRALSTIRATLEVEDIINEFMRDHRYIRAESAVVEPARRDPKSTDAQMRLGLYYKAVGRVYQARLAFEKAIALAPHDPHGYGLLAETYSGFWGIPGEGFDRQSIMGIYDRAMTNVPARTWAVNRKAWVSLMGDRGEAESTNHIAEAEGYFRELLKEDAQSYKALAGLGTVNRLRGNYDEAEDFYRKALQVQPRQVDPRAGIWLCMAYAGHDEEACNAIAAYYGNGQQMGAEVARVATLLMLARKYEFAARLYDRVVESAPRPELIQKMSRLLRRAEKVKREDYETFFDDSSPEALAQTFMIAGIMGDTNRLFRCVAPAVSREELERRLRPQSSAFASLLEKMGTNYFGDIILSVFEVSKRTLDNGNIEVKLDGSRLAGFLATSFPGVATLEMQRVGDRWRAITLEDPEVDCSTLSRLALEALDRGNIRDAIAWQVRLAELVRQHRSARGNALSAAAEHLQQIAFTNDVLRVKAWAGMGLASSHTRENITRGASCLEEVVAAHPDDVHLKLMFAAAQYQLANMQRSAAILSSINCKDLASPDQLGWLGQTLVNLEKLDASEGAFTRLRELAPEDDRLLLLQAHVLELRGQYAEATSKLIRLRDRSKLDNGSTIPNQCGAIAHSGNKSELRDLIDRYREPQKPLFIHRPRISRACLALGLRDEASEQIATMLAEGGLTTEALIGYAEVALARGDAAEARHLVSVADRLANRFPESDPSDGLAMVHLALGDYADAARYYREHGTRTIYFYSGYSVCMSAIASRLAGDLATANETLKLAATMQGDSDWPRLAIQYISGAISEKEFLRAPERTTLTPALRASRECEVNCMVGLLKEAGHDLPGALAAYQACAATKAVNDFEYLIAQFALQRLRVDNQKTVGNKSPQTRL